MDKIYQKKWREKNPEKNKEYQRKYQKNNPEKVKESQRKYYYKNQKKQVAKSKRWNDAHPELHRKRALEWNKNNIEKHRANKKTYRLKNLEKCRERNKKWYQNGGKEWTKKYHNEYFKRPEVKEHYKNYMKEWYLKRREKLVGSPKPSNCPVCGRKEFRNGRSKGRICVDHCHKTGKIRGWLCDDCNVALGRVDDRIDILRNLIKYLNKNV